MRIFGSDRISGLMQRLGMEEGVPIEHGMVTRAIERAQKQVEAQNFSVRKHLLEYDDVMNKQRESVYTLRREILEGKVHVDRGRARRHAASTCSALAEEILDDTIERFAGKQIDVERVGPRRAEQRAHAIFGSRLPELEELQLDDKTTRRDRRRALGPPSKRTTTRRSRSSARSCCGGSSATSCCRSSTRSGRTTSTRLDHLKEGIGLRGYGQRDPLVEYKKESFALFQDMKARIEEEIVRYLLLLRPVVSEEAAAVPRAARSPRRRRSC